MIGMIIESFTRKGFLFSLKAEDKTPSPLKMIAKEKILKHLGEYFNLRKFASLS
jgi:hypothetical protein